MGATMSCRTCSMVAIQYATRNPSHCTRPPRHQLDRTALLLITSLVGCGIVKGDSLVAACCVATLSTVHACAIGQLTVTESALVCIVQHRVHAFGKQSSEPLNQRIREARNHSGDVLAEHALRGLPSTVCWLPLQNAHLHLS